MNSNFSYTPKSLLNKIYLSPLELYPKIEELKNQGKIIVFGNGCFDLLHVGHIRYLYGAKELGDILLVAINTDKSMQIIKPDRKPSAPDYERFELIASISAVDYVVPLREKTPIELLNLFRPNIHTKGTDYTLDKLPEREVVESYGGKIMFVGGPKEHSTTQMLDSIKSS